MSSALLEVSRDGVVRWATRIEVEPALLASGLSAAELPQVHLTHAVDALASDGTLVRLAVFVFADKPIHVLFRLDGDDCSFARLESGPRIDWWIKQLYVDDAGGIEFSAQTSGAGFTDVGYFEVK